LSPQVFACHFFKSGAFTKETYHKWTRQSCTESPKNNLACSKTFLVALNRYTALILLSIVTRIMTYHRPCCSRLWLLKKVKVARHWVKHSNVVGGLWSLTGKLQRR
jgi:hypothetical protein